MFGIVATGASLGGTVIPIAARNLIELVGYMGILCVRVIIVAHKLPQVQVDNAFCRSGRTLHAHDRESGENFHPGLS